MPSSTDSAASIIRKADQCVRCGLCLPVCPTYALDRRESESPRGRIALLQALAEKQMPATTTLDSLDHCLGCRACEPVCPARVPYGELLLEGRAWLNETRGDRAGFSSRLRRQLLARPATLNRLLGLARPFWRFLPAALRRGLPRPPRMRRLTEKDEAEGNGSVQLFLGCVARRYERDALSSASDLLNRLGWGVRIPTKQTCCGAQAAHSGDARLARSLQDRNKQAFDEFLPVLALDSGCQDALASGLTSPVQDLFSFVDGLPQALEFQPPARSSRIAVLLPCTQRRIEGSAPALRRLLSKIPGVQIDWLQAGCCGAAGSHMTDYPERAAALRQPILEQLASLRPDRLLVANIGCRLHLQNGLEDLDLDPTVQHPVEFLLECLVSDAQDDTRHVHR